MNISLTTLAMSVSGAAPKYSQKFDYPLALNVTLVGITVVFSALILLALCVYLYSSIFTSVSKTFKNKKSSNNTPAVQQPKSVEKEQIADEELIAVLTAAISASLRYEPSCNLRVKSFKRISQSSPSWNTAGRHEHVSSRM